MQQRATGRTRTLDGASVPGPSYDVCQHQRSFCRSRKLQFVIKTVKYHLVMCETTQ